MRKFRSVPGLATVLMLAMVAMLTMRCESQESPEIEEPEERGFVLLQEERFAKRVKIHINRPQGTIRVVPPHVDICGEEASCPEDQFNWWIQSGLEENERLVIRGVRESCFAWDRLEITPPSNAALSGPFLPKCQADDKYGYYWPYAVELFKGEDLIAETDPSGIFRR